MEDKNKSLAGVWKLFHRFCVNAKDDDIVWLIPFIKNMCKSTGCEYCNKHATQYIKDNKPEEAYARGGYDGLFEWGVNFHNKVNNDLKKDTMTVAEARSYYTVGCTDCKAASSSVNNSKANDFLDKATMKKKVVFL